MTLPTYLLVLPDGRQAAYCDGGDPADPAAPPTLDDLTSWTLGKLASYKKPTGIVVLDEPPRNASGKVLKHELRTRYGHSVG